MGDRVQIPPPSMDLGGYLGDLVVPHGSHGLPGLIAGSIAPAAEVEAECPEGWHGRETCSGRAGAGMGWTETTAASQKDGRGRGEWGKEVSADP